MFGLGAKKRPGRGTVLLVDDECDILRLMSLVLNRHGFTVLEAGNGSEAVAVSARYAKPIHVLVTDLVMPGTDGFMLSKRLKKTRPEMRQIWISGYADTSFAVRQELQESDTPFLAKPCAPADLVRMVRTEVAHVYPTPS